MGTFEGEGDEENLKLEKEHNNKKRKEKEKKKKHFLKKMQLKQGTNLWYDFKESIN